MPTKTEVRAEGASKTTSAKTKKAPAQRSARSARQRDLIWDQTVFSGKETPETHRPKWALSYASHELPIGALQRDEAHDISTVTVKLKVRAETADAAEAKVRALLGLWLGTDSEIGVS